MQNFLFRLISLLELIYCSMIRDRLWCLKNIIDSNAISVENKKAIFLEKQHRNVRVWRDFTATFWLDVTFLNIHKQRMQKVRFAEKVSAQTTLTDA